MLQFWQKSSSHSTMLCSTIFSGVLLGVYGFKGRGKEIPGTQSSFCESVSILFAPLCDAFLKEWQNFFWLLQTWKTNRKRSTILDKKKSLDALGIQIIFFLAFSDVTYR